VSENDATPVNQKPARVYDWPTLVAITLVVYAMSTVIHEGLGHGGACLLMGDQPRVVSTVHFECSRDTRFMMAGGTIANLIAGLIFVLLLHRMRSAPASVRYFLWLSMTINLLRAAGYLIYSGIGNIGDWSEFIAGFGNQWAWRSGMTVLGAIAYWMFIRKSLTELLPFIGSNGGTVDDKRVERAHRLTIDPYLAGGVFECIAGLFNPIGMLLVAVSAAAAAFGGGSGLGWMSHLLHGNRFPIGPAAPPMEIRRSWTWIACAAAVAVVYVGFLGPGLRLS